ncbi:MAG: hypothetical protein DHS20C06_17980 [Hyphobacterium sp.]|nr:MAG: hypothetical protein DHS20C06_17980 [Hyphobacterium sp.]
MDWARAIKFMDVVSVVAGLTGSVPDGAEISGSLQAERSAMAAMPMRAEFWRCVTGFSFLGSNYRYYCFGIGASPSALSVRVKSAV